jgi:predicted nuclease with TOPRIM domain
MTTLTTQEKLNMSLDEIQINEQKITIETMEKKINKLIIKNNLLLDANNSLQYDNKQLKNKYNEMSETINLYDWIIHISDDSKEYVSGYRYGNPKLYDTSYILHKIPLSTYLLVITENETLYILPYTESNK